MKKKKINTWYPIPNINELIDEFHGEMYFSKIDFQSGYHRIWVRKEDIHKKMFICHYENYEFLVMPFGLNNTLDTF